jgi:hypothetical protein
MAANTPKGIDSRMSMSKDYANSIKRTKTVVKNQNIRRRNTLIDASRKIPLFKEGTSSDIREFVIEEDMDED